MFELDWEKILVIAVVAIVVIGPKDLPRALRAVGQWVGRAKRMAREFQNQFNEAIREAELDGVQREIEQIANMDPLADVRAAAAKAGHEVERDLQSNAAPATTQSAPAVAQVQASPTPVGAADPNRTSPP